MTRKIIPFLIFLFCFSFAGSAVVPMPAAQAVEIASPSSSETAVSSVGTQTPSLFLDEDDEESKLPKACQFSFFNLTMGSLLACVIGSIMGGITAFFLFVGAMFIDFTIALNATIYDEGSIARTGFDLSLEMTNLVFVIAIIVIAFSIMLRRDIGGRSGGAMLAKLIIVALLINFSFFFATTLIKVSDGITTVFIDAATENNGWKDMTDHITGAFLIKSGDEMVANSDTWKDAAKEVLSQEMLKVAGMLFAILFGALAVFVIFAIGVMFLIRFVVLTILIILLPFALIGVIFSSLSWWGTWTKKFTSWLIFGPAMAFFIYLSFALLGSAQHTNITKIEGSFGAMGGLIAVIGILFGGMMTANKLGVEGGSTVISLANSGKAWASGKMKSAAIQSGRWAQRKSLTAGARPSEGKASYASRTGKFLAETPVLRSIGGLAAAGGIDKGVAGLSEHAGERQKRLTHLSDDILVARANATSNTLADTATKAALAGELAKRGLTEKVDAGKYQNFAEAAAKMGVGGDLFMTRPDLAASLKKDVASSTRKVKEASKISEVAFKNREVLGALLKPQIEDIGKFGKEPQKTALYRELSTVVDSNETMKQVTELQHNIKTREAEMKDIAGTQDASLLQYRDKIAQEKGDFRKQLDIEMQKLTATEKGIVQNYGLVSENPHFSKPLGTVPAAPVTKQTSASMTKERSEELKKPAYIRKKEQGDNWRS